MTYTLGVDLGTTFSAAAVHRDGTTEIVALAHRAMVVPSAVLVTAEGDVLVGDAALRRGTTEPGRLAREFKRLLGDPVPVLVGGEPYTAEALTALLLERLVAGVSEQQGGPPERVVLTFPANWGPHKQGLLAEAARLAHIDQGYTLTEPEAAAIWYQSAERVAPGETVAVYDLGGGTFDAAVLRKTDTGFEVLGTPHGIERLGGIDADEAIFRHVCQVLDLDLKALAADENARRALARLRAECVDAKEALSADTTVTIPVTLPDLHRDVRLTRRELEAMVRPVLEDSIQALRQTITSAGLAPDDIDRVLLVGGSSRMPIVADLVTRALGRPFFVDAHPKHVVALGAALAATTPEHAGARPVALPRAPVHEAEAPTEPETPQEPATPTEPERSEPTPGASRLTSRRRRSRQPAAAIQQAESTADQPTPELLEPVATTEPASGKPAIPPDAVKTGEPTKTLEPTKAPETRSTPLPAPEREADDTDGDTATEPEASAVRRWRWVAVPAVLVLIGVAIMVSRGGGGDGSSSSSSTDDTPRPVVEGNPGGEVVDLALFADGAPDSIDPASVTTFASAQIVELLYDGLTGIDVRDPDASRVVPKVAESYNANDDATVWTFTLHEGLEFSDGSPVLPSSFVRGWERATDPSLATQDAPIFDIIEGAEERREGDAETIEGLHPDDEAMTLEVHLTEPVASFDAVVGHPHFMPVPEAVEELDDQSEWDNGDMVGNGPFVLDTPWNGDEVVLVPNQGWDGTLYEVALHLPDKPFLDKITFRPSSDLEAAYQAFTGGEGNVTGVPAELYEEASEEYPNTFSAPRVESFHLQVNWEDETVGGTENRLLRQAISQAIDRGAVNDMLFGGSAQTASGITPPAVVGFTEGLCDYCAYDPQSAKAAFEAWKAEGNELDELLIQSEAPPGASHGWVDSMVQDLNAVGIPAREEPIGSQDSPEDYLTRLRAGDCMVCPVSAPVALIYEDLLSVFHTKYLGDPNVGRFSVESFDEMVDEASTTTDLDERFSVLREAEQLLLNEEVGVVPLLWYTPPSHMPPLVYDDELAPLVQTNLGMVVWERAYFV